MTPSKPNAKSSSNPTAQALLADVAATPLRMPPPGLGLALGTRAHAVPFQRSMTVLLTSRAFWAAPLTTQALRADVAPTPQKMPLPGWSGAGTCRHAWPFQCRTSAWLAVQLPLNPTAQTSLADVAATPSRLPSRTGLCITVQALPFQCSMMVWLVFVPPSPTAHASVAEVTVTAASAPTRSGLGVCRHTLPFQCKISGRRGPDAHWYCPTAQASLADVAATPNNAGYSKDEVTGTLRARAADAGKAVANAPASSNQVVTAPYLRTALAAFIPPALVPVPNRSGPTALRRHPPKSCHTRHSLPMDARGPGTSMKGFSVVVENPSGS